MLGGSDRASRPLIDSYLFASIQPTDGRALRFTAVGQNGNGSRPASCLLPFWAASPVRSQCAVSSARIRSRDSFAGHRGRLRVCFSRSALNSVAMFATPPTKLKALFRTAALDPLARRRRPAVAGSYRHRFAPGKSGRRRARARVRYTCFNSSTERGHHE